MIFRERHLQVVWGLGWYCPDGLRTEDGRAVFVEDPGIPNSGAGPDFRDARLRIGSRHVRGDVELHLRSDGWAEHHHDEAGSYSSVVLHVALYRGRRSCPASIPELILSPALSKSQVELVEELAFSGGRHAVSPLPNFEKLGEVRFQRKVDRLKRLGGMASPGQIFYRNVLIALGYRPNGAPFEELSRLVPLAMLQRRSRSGIEDLLRERARTLSWRKRGVRPGNHPLRRISGVARWLSSVPMHRPQEPHLEDPLGASFDPTGEGFIGMERGRVLRDNVVLPFAVAYGTPRQAAKALDLFRSLPPGPVHRRVRDAQWFFQESPPLSLRSEWGLIEGFEKHH